MYWRCMIKRELKLMIKINEKEKTKRKFMRFLGQLIY